MPSCESLQQMKVRLDSDLRRNNQGTALIGGSPTRLLRLTTVGARLLDGWADGAPVGSGRAERKLVSRLLDAGIVHPIVAPVEITRREDEAAGSFGVVVPVFNDAAGLESTLAALRQGDVDAPIVVVDDASTNASAITAVAKRYDATLLRHETNQGPAAARNTGWRSLAGELNDDAIIAFVDADVAPLATALATLRAHFQIAGTGVVAPRVRAANGESVLDRYEAVRSPLDLGDEPARVRAGSRVSYVPAAVLAVRLSVLVALDGFVASMRSGEDVDFVWRADRGGWQVRYEPAAAVEHRNRTTLVALARQRFTYGSAAADLADRHPGDLAPVSASAPMFAIWVLLLFGGRTGTVAASGGAVAMAHQVQQLLVDHSAEPLVDAVRMSGKSHASLARWLAAASTRAWLPMLIAASMFSSRARRWLMASAVAPAAIDWFVKRPALDPARFAALSMIDDAAYCAGVIRGCVDRRSLKALLPRVLPTGFRRVDGSAS